MSLMASLAPAWTASLLHLLEPQAPLSFIEYQVPGRTAATMEYDCAGERVRLVIEALPGSVQVTQFDTGSRAATEQELTAWNEGLVDLAEFDYATLRCRSGGHRLVTIQGGLVPLVPTKRSVLARWDANGLIVVRAEAEDDSALTRTTAELAAGIGSIVITAGCAPSSEEPSVEMLTQRVMERAPELSAQSSEALSNALTPAEMNALRAFVATPEGASIAEKWPEITATLASVGTSTLCPNDP